MRTVKQTLSSLQSPQSPELSAPKYSGGGCRRYAMLAVESMRHHMTDEGWQLQQGLACAGYTLCGCGLHVDSVDVLGILEATRPDVLVCQDKREWEGLTADRKRNPEEVFHGVAELRRRDDVFKLTVLKDAQNSTEYHRQAAEEMGAHAWVVYYHPSIVKRVAPYVREQHLVRTYHSVDANSVPKYTTVDRRGAVVSGAVSGAYPLRKLAYENTAYLSLGVIPHPGYHRNGTSSHVYLRQLARYKVALCTSSVYGYALRKLIEATAAGCVVVTDLPSDEVLPHIDLNLVRVSPSVRIEELRDVLKDAVAKYCPERQERMARLAAERYDYRHLGQELAVSVAKMRLKYADAKQA